MCCAFYFIVIIFLHYLTSQLLQCDIVFIILGGFALFNSACLQLADSIFTKVFYLPQLNWGFISLLKNNKKAVHYELLLFFDLFLAEFLFDFFVVYQNSQTLPGQLALFKIKA